MFKLLLTLILIYNNSFAWTLEMNLDRFVPLTKNPNYLSNFTGQVSKYNRTAYMLNVLGDLNKVIDNRFQVRMDLFAKQGNEFRRIFTKIEPDACKFIKEDEIFYKDLVKYTNFPDGCPLVPGHYFIKNYILKLPEGLPAIFLTAQDWKMYGACEFEGQAVFAIEVYFNIKKY